MPMCPGWRFCCSGLARQANVEKGSHAEWADGAKNVLLVGM
jgi:hypothetical protein